MTDDVTIRFTADVSDLQKGLQQATAAVDATTGALRSGASQINASFSALSDTYTRNATQRGTVEQATTQTILDNLAKQSAAVKEQAKAGQISRPEELASLLSIESQRASTEVASLGRQEGNSQDAAKDYKGALDQIEELLRQSARRRQEIERSVTEETTADYRRSFERIGSSVSSSIMGMIQGHETLGKAAQKVALSIIQSFVQAKVRMVADWAAGMAAQTSLTAASEAAKTAAVAEGAAARTGLETTASAASAAGTVASVLKSIGASAGETFAGIFGFLAPVMGPAAAGPAAAGEATVLSVGAGLASFAVGAWSLPSDMIAQVHQGEMIIPAGPAAAFRNMMESNSGVAGTVHVHHATNFNVQAIDSAGVKQFFKDHGKVVLRAINESVRTGSHLGLSKLGG